MVISQSKVEKPMLDHPTYSTSVVSLQIRRMTEIEWKVIWEYQMSSLGIKTSINWIENYTEVRNKTWLKKVFGQEQLVYNTHKFKLLSLTIFKIFLIS